jgi:hypothetical protein
MPRYFFNMVEGHSKNIVRDSEGTEFSAVREARREAVGLARDVARHELHGSAHTWKVVVTDENGAEVLTVPLSEIRAPKIWAWLSSLHGRIVNFESSVSAHTLTWLVTAAVLAVIVQAAMRTVLVREQGGNYRTASAPTEGAIVAVRFVAQASAAEITEFLDAYKASLVAGPRPGGFYSVRISGTTLPQEELAKIVSRMAKDKVVDFAAAVQ